MGVDAKADEVGANLARLYDFILHVLPKRDQESVESSLTILRTLRESFEEIRPEAVRLEHEGAIPALES